MSSPGQTSVALIVVTHNSAQWLRGFIDSWNQTVAASAANAPHDIEFFAVDAGSTDDSVALLQTLRPNLDLQQCSNVGYGTAVNRAAARATAQWLLICNPDLTFSQNFLSAFLGMHLPQLLASTGQLGCIAPRLTNADGSPQPSVGSFPTIRTLIRDQFRPRPLRKYQSPQPTQSCVVDWASGACLVVERQAFARAAGFDERYFLYMEEVDLQRRLHDAGYSTIYVPNLAVVHHNPNAQQPPRAEIQRYAARGLLRYFAKFSPFSLLIYRLLALATSRLPPAEALASKKSILARATGP